MLKNVVFNNVVVYTDRYAISKDGELEFLSIYGSTQSVNAILAAAAGYYPLDVQFQGKPVSKLTSDAVTVTSGEYFRAQRTQIYGRSTHIKSIPLSWGRAHGIFWDEICILRKTKSDFIAIGPNERTAREKVFQTVSTRPVPLIPEWTDALFEILNDRGYIFPLISHGCFAYYLRYDEEELLSVLSEYIRCGTLQLKAAA